MKDFYLTNKEDEEQFFLNNNWLICSLIMNGIEISMKENLDTYGIFRIHNLYEHTLTEFNVNKKEWLKSLNKCLEFFLSVEEYEICVKIRDMITKITTN